MKKKYIIIFLIIISAFIGIKNINALEVKSDNLLNIVESVGELPSQGFGDTGETCANIVGENLGKVIKLGVSMQPCGVCITAQWARDVSSLAIIL